MPLPTELSPEMEEHLENLSVVNRTQRMGVLSDYGTDDEQNAKKRGRERREEDLQEEDFFSPMLRKSCHCSRKQDMERIVFDLAAVAIAEAVNTQSGEKDEACKTKVLKLFASISESEMEARDKTIFRLQLEKDALQRRIKLLEERLDLSEQLNLSYDKEIKELRQRCQPPPQ